MLAFLKFIEPEPERPDQGDDGGLAGCPVRPPEALRAAPPAGREACPPPPQPGC